MLNMPPDLGVSTLEELLLGAECALANLFINTSRLYETTKTYHTLEVAFRLAVRGNKVTLPVGITNTP